MYINFVRNGSVFPNLSQDTIFLNTIIVLTSGKALMQLNVNKT